MIAVLYHCLTYARRLAAAARARRTVWVIAKRFTVHTSLLCGVRPLPLVEHLDVLDKPTGIDEISECGKLASSTLHK